MANGRGEHESPPNQWDQYGPFGTFGHEEGEWALTLLDQLPGPTLSEPTVISKHVLLDSSDTEAFDTLREFDTGIRFIEPHPDLDGREIGDLHRLFEDLHVALPFTEGERRWLNWQGKTLDAIAGQPVKLMESGVLRELNGDDVIRRWWAWRRERDEFAGQDSLELARHTLSEIAHRLVTAENWPSEYAHLRRK